MRMKRGPLSLLAGAVVLVMLAATTGGISASAMHAGAAAPIGLWECSTAQLGDVMNVYMTTPTPHATPPPVPANVRSYLAHVLRQRLTQCEAHLPGYTQHGVSGAAAACRPERHENDVLRLWTHLQFCVTLVHAPAPTPSGIAWRLPAELGTANRPVIFVLGAGSDHAMVEKLVSTLTQYLNDGKDETGYHFADDATLVPEPSWTPEQYADACQNSADVEGAVIMQITASGSGAADELIRRRSWTAVEATALYADCHRDPGSSRGIPRYVWISDMAAVQNQRVTLTPLTPLAMLLTLGAAYEEFAPSRTTQVSTTRVFNNPAKPPPPPSGRVTQVTTSNGTALNAAGLSSVAGSFLGSAISYTNVSAPLVQAPTVDQQTWEALQSLAIKLVQDMNCWQPESHAISPPSAHDVIGTARILPAYNPPAGLDNGAYSPGESSAPFCREPAQSESIEVILP
jgi:hypothetical protein